jgi:hypothetical protein
VAKNSYADPPRCLAFAFQLTLPSELLSTPQHCPVSLEGARAGQMFRHTALAWAVCTTHSDLAVTYPQSWLWVGGLQPKCQRVTVAVSWHRGQLLR